MPKLISEKTFQTIEIMLEAGGQSYADIAEAAGVEQSLVCTIARGKHSYSAKRDKLRRSRADTQQIYLPTPEQHRLGGYETWMGTNRLEIEASTKIEAELLTLLERVAEAK